MFKGGGTLHGIKGYCSVMCMSMEMISMSYSRPFRTPIRNILSIDFLNFLMYLSASDWDINDEEVTFIREHLDFNLSKKSIQELIKEYNIYTVDYEKKIPYSMKLFVEADNNNFHPQFFIERVFI